MSIQVPPSRPSLFHQREQRFHPVLNAVEPLPGHLMEWICVIFEGHLRFSMDPCPGTPEGMKARITKAFLHLQGRVPGSRRTKTGHTITAMGGHLHRQAMAIIPIIPAQARRPNTEMTSMAVCPNIQGPEACLRPLVGIFRIRHPLLWIQSIIIARTLHRMDRLTMEDAGAIMTVGSSTRLCHLRVPVPDAAPRTTIMVPTRLARPCSSGMMWNQTGAGRITANGTLSLALTLTMIIGGFLILIPIWIMTVFITVASRLITRHITTDHPCLRFISRCPHTPRLLQWPAAETTWIQEGTDWGLQMAPLITT